MIELLLTLILVILFVMLIAISRLREDLIIHTNELVKAYNLAHKARQGRRLPAGPDVDAKPPVTHRRDSDDLPRTGRQATGLKFVKRGGSDDRPNDDDRLQQES